MVENFQSKSGKVYIVGAGIAGLSAAVACVKKGHNVSLFEAARHAGGRCRSFEDSVLERVIDNGNHLILSGNYNIKQYLKGINATGNFEPVDPVRFEFVDLDADHGEEMPAKRPPIRIRKV